MGVPLTPATRLSPDQQLQDAAKAMTAAAAQGQPVVPVLEKHCPHIYRQVLRDGKFPGLLSLWGRSVNVDENVGETIVHPAILQAIGELAGVPLRVRVVHAGLEHTYGYLFSLIETPYGTKRERWLSTRLERGFGLDLSLFGDRPKEGTLLANVTWFLAQIVYRDRPRTLRRLGASAPAPAPALLGYDYARLAVCRVVEQVVLPTKSGREVLLVTDLVPFPFVPPDPDADSTLLVYSVQNGARSPLKLVTAFPVTAATAGAIKASVPPDGTVDVRLRYNAYVPGLDGRTVPGRRFFVGPPC
jgi:hypothetical protein